MVPFLQIVARHLVSRFGDDLGDLCIVLPNRRGGLFLRRYLATEVGKVTWSPAVFSIEDFIAEIGGLQEVENLHLLFELYEVHGEVEGTNAQTFEEFLRWAPQLLSDFNEIDRCMADVETLFTTLTEARAISLWNPDGKPLTDFEKNYLRFYKSLYIYYEKLTKRLSAKNQAYQGLAFRHAAQNMEVLKNRLSWRHIIFAGFNALTTAEERIIDTLQKAGLATLLWDADKYYVNNNQQEAGDFLRGWLPRWTSKEPTWLFDDLATSEKQIEIIGSPDPVGQVKICGQLLKELAKDGLANENTAVVLLDEGLLVSMLNSIPQEVESLNITAGFPLRQTPLAGLLEMLCHMHLNAARFTGLVSKGIRKYYYKDVLKLLLHPYMRRMDGGMMNGNRAAFNGIVDRIRMGQQVFFGIGDISAQDSGLLSADLVFLESIFTPWDNPDDMLKCLKNLIEMLRLSTVDDLDMEYLFAFSKILHQMDNLLKEFSSGLKIPAVYDLFRQVIDTTSLPFYGEPLRGVQLMGMLETRTLDFENLIILSCNEDLLPGGKTNTSFIPFDLKKTFGIPTYRYRDSVYAYHFYRLIQRAKRAWIIYNTEPDQLGGGERSRFLRQIASELPAYNPGITIRESILTSPMLKIDLPPVIEIPKTSEAVDLLKDKAVKGFSATSLNTFRNCALKFYFSEIAGIKEPENIEDTIDPAVLGSAVHEALYNLYKPVIGNPLTIESLQVMEKNADGEVDKAFDKKFKGSDISFGKNLLLVRVAGLMVKRLLKYEADQLTQLAKSGEKMNIAFLEQLVETKISIRHNDSMLDIRIKGFIDRVDKMDGCWRIMDYKTGTTEAGHVKVKDWDDLITAPELNIGFQLLMYGYLLGKMFPSPMISCAGILSLKKLNAGFMAVSVPGDDPVKLTTTLNVSATNRFEQVIRTILSEIYDLGKPFTQTTDLNICLRCPYVNLCGR